MLDQPARAVRSLSSPDPRDAASNFTRELEKGNIRATIAANPLLGVGFGREYLIVSYVPGLEGFPLWRFEPHNTVMWLWLKLGAIGFVLFWLLIGTAITRAAQLAKTVREAQTFAVLTLTGIISVLVFSYVDLGMTAGRLTSFLGILIGVLAALERTPEAVPAVPSTARSLDVRWAS
jgi:O-antigen ligase